MSALRIVHPAVWLVALLAVVVLVLTGVLPVLWLIAGQITALLLGLSVSVRRYDRLCGRR